MYTSVPQEWVRLHVHYAVLHALWMCTMKVFNFSGLKSCMWLIFEPHVLLLTSSVYVPSFIIIRLIVLELSWKQTDRRTDRQTGIQDNRIKHSCGILNKKSKTLKSSKGANSLVYKIITVQNCIILFYFGRLQA